ncbi:MAG: hypothetical protein Q7T16_04420 [Candidatus Burarchaeum sp.]|nr:hypothetical protein [Candidatus Burarchaeum sp.]MDO8339873.1 hypothetical protein [Candidatus Burarchaeum sp.]
MQVICLRNPLFVVLVFLLVAMLPLAAAASTYCTKADIEDMKTGCAYEIPGGEISSGPGKEIVASSTETFNDGHLLIVRTVSIIRAGSISYSVPNVADMSKETEVSYKITNEEGEPVKDFEIKQQLIEGQTYSLYVGGLAARANKTVSFSLPGVFRELGEPVLNYNLPTVTLKASDGMIGKEADIWLRAGSSTPVAGESIEITSPSGFQFTLISNEGGKASFVPREVGTYVFSVPHRKIASSAYMQALQEVSLPANTASLNETAQGGLPATAALVVGTLRAEAGSAIRALGPIGIAVVVLLVALGAWTYLQIRRPGEDETLIAGQDVPPELAPYKEGEQAFMTEKGSISTDIDHLVKLVHDKKRIDVNEAAKMLRIAPQEVERWARMLEEEKALQVEYSMTNMFLVWKGKSRKMNGMLKEEERRRLMDSAILLSPRQSGEGMIPTEKPKRGRPRKNK